MAMRCFGRVRFTEGTARVLVLRSFAVIDLRAVDLAAALRVDDFFWAAVRMAARAVGFFVGFFLAIDGLPFRYPERLARIAVSRVGMLAFANPASKC